MALKTELIEYHRKRARFNELRASDFPSDSPECLEHNGKLIFHERAVAWLESRPDDVPGILVHTPEGLTFIKP